MLLLYIYTSPAPEFKVKNSYLRVTIITQTRGTKGEMKPFVQQNVLLCDITFVFSSHRFQGSYKPRKLLGSCKLVCNKNL